MRRALTWIAGILLLGLTAASLLPLLETDIWWVRFLDFPRMQFGAALLMLWIVFALAGGLGRGAGRWLTILVIAALAYHGWRLWPYQPLAARMAPGGAQCEEAERLRVLVANVQKTNRQADEVIALARAERPDLFIVLETNDWWDEALGALDADYPHHMQDIPADAAFFGMHVFSSHAFAQAGMRYPFGVDTPLFEGVLDHPAGRIRVFGVHPRPPHVAQPSTMRDAVMLEAAMEARESDLPVLMAGDFNAAPWERTARRTLRLGELVDPRAGRGPMVSFDANSWWMKWPLDQVLWQEGLAMRDFAVLADIGSDHYPVRADLCLGSKTAPRLVPMRPDDPDEARRTFERARAMAQDDAGG